jgi:hypothetical protein
MTAFAIRVVFTSKASITWIGSVQWDCRQHSGSGRRAKIASLATSLLLHRSHAFTMSPLECQKGADGHRAMRPPPSCRCIVTFKICNLIETSGVSWVAVTAEP